MSTQQAAVLVAKGEVYQVQTREIYKPEEGEILVRNHVIATNPADHIVRALGLSVTDWDHTIPGTDIAGTVEEVGEGVTQWKRGDKVYGVSFVDSWVTRHGAFQEYTSAPADHVGQIPNNFSFEQAAALALPIITAASGFYVAAKLPRPYHKRPTITNDSPVMYINSASSAVGSGALQLARLHGFRVIASSSPKNFELVKSLGASEVFDHRDPDLVQKVKSAAGKPIEYAFDAYSKDNSIQQCVDILEGKGSLIIVFLLPSIDLKATQVYQAHATALFKDQKLAQWWWSFAKAAAEEGTLVPLKHEVMGTSVQDINKVVDFHATGQVSGFRPVVKLI